MTSGYARDCWGNGFALFKWGGGFGDSLMGGRDTNGISLSRTVQRNSYSPELFRSSPGLAERWVWDYLIIGTPRRMSSVQMCTTHGSLQTLVRCGTSKPVMPKKGQYPLNVVFSTALQADDGPANAANGVIRDEDGLRRLPRRQADLLVGWVDFEKEQLIFVALGQCHPPLEVQIHTVVHMGDRGEFGPLSEVSYQENPSRTPIAAEEPALTSPIHVIKLKKLLGDTVFTKSERG
jgi:hypothetical protein